MAELNALAGNLSSWSVVWNLFLALLPWAGSTLLLRSPRLPWPLAIAGIGLVILFLPNAPYLLTDFIHLFRFEQQQPRQISLGVPVYLAIAFFGMLGYSGTLVNLRRIWGLLGHPQTWPPVLLTLHSLSAWGVWMGRSLRLNSWDLLDHPQRVVRDAVALLVHLDYWGELVSLALLLALSHQLLQYLYWPQVRRDSLRQLEHRP